MEQPSPTPPVQGSSPESGSGPSAPPSPPSATPPAPAAAPAPQGPKWPVNGPGEITLDHIPANLKAEIAAPAMKEVARLTVIQARLMTALQRNAAKARNLATDFEDGLELTNHHVRQTAEQMVQMLQGRQ